MHRKDVAHRHGGMQILHLALGDVALVLTLAILPAGTLQEKPVHVDALGWQAGNLRQISGVVESAPVGHVIQGQSAASGRHLHVGGQEGHGVEEPTDPNGFQQLQRGSPLDHLLVALHEVIKPGAQSFQRGVRLLCPAGIHLVALEVCTQRLHPLRDVQGATDTQLQLEHGPSDLIQQAVDAVGLLQGDHDEGSVVFLLQATSDVNHVEVRWELAEVVRDDRLSQGDVAGAATATSAGDLLDRLEDADALIREEANLSVGVQSEHLRHLQGESLLDVLDVVRVLKLAGIWRFEAGCQVSAGQELWRNQHRQVGVVHTSVPRIRDVTAIHNLAEDVAQVRPGHLRTQVLSVVQIVLQHLPANGQVAIVEGVLLGPSLSSELNSA
mmetsp:Transcript_57669/g.137355  ORF Transcript_57669/g.137355 Transcript_57669/m.137355 type:complete len:383 (+) Transcript_57669:202-1350(+)